MNKHFSFNISSKININNKQILKTIFKNYMVFKIDLVYLTRVTITET